MATVDKNFKVKHGLVVEGTTATVNGNDILTTADVATGNTPNTIVERDAYGAITVGTVHANGILGTSGQDGNDLGLYAGNDMSGIEIKGSGGIHIFTNAGEKLLLNGWTAADEVATVGYVDNAVPDNTDGLSEGTTNKYFTDQRAKDAAASLIANATKTNIVITGDGNGLTITAENGVADSTTTDLAEGMNLYFTDERAQDAVGLNVGGGLDYNDTTGAIFVSTNNSLEIDGITDALKINRATVDTWYDASGSASTAQSNAETFTTNAINALTTSDIEEGSNLYFTTARAESAAKNAISGSGVISVNGGTVGLSYDGSTINTDGFGKLAVNTSVIATKAYADGIAQGLNAKNSVNLATTANIDLSATFNLSNLSGFENTMANAGDRVLVKHQDFGSGNGIYVFQTNGTLVLEETPAVGDFVFNENTARGYIVIDLGSNGDGATWTQFSAAGQYVSGTGININGNTISIDPTTVATTSSVNERQIALTAGNGISLDTLGNISVDPGFGISTNTSGVNVDTSIFGSGLHVGAADITVDTNVIASVNYVDTNFVNVADLPGQLGDYVPLTQKAANNGVATLDGSGQVPLSQLGNVPDAYVTSVGTNLSVTGGELDIATTPTFTAVDFGSVAKQVAAKVDNIGSTPATLYSFKIGPLTDAYTSAEYTIASYATKMGVPSSTYEREITKILLTTDNAGNVAITEYGTVTMNDHVLDITAEVVAVGTPGMGGYYQCNLIASSAISGVTVDHATVAGTLFK